MAVFGEGFRAVFLKGWLSATRRETQILFGNDNKNKDLVNRDLAKVPQITDMNASQRECSAFLPGYFQPTAYFTEGLSSAFRSPSAY